MNSREPFCLTVEYKSCREIKSTSFVRRNEQMFQVASAFYFAPRIRFGFAVGCFFYFLGSHTPSSVLPISICPLCEKDEEHCYNLAHVLPLALFSISSALVSYHVFIRWV